MLPFLFIPSIQSGDFPALYTKCGVVLIFWVLVIVAVLLDLWSGIDRARAIGEKTRSDKFRRTVTKIGDYWRVLAFGLLIDVIASILPFYTLAYASILASIACVMIEGKSVIENSRAKKSAAAKIPSLIAEMLEYMDQDKAAEFIRKAQNLSEKHIENK